MQADFSTFGGKLAWSITRRGTSKSALAVATGISPSAVTQWLTNETQNHDAVNIFSAARFLNVNAEWLETGLGSPERLSTVGGLAGSAIETLPRAPLKEALDFLLYKLKQSEPPQAQEIASRYIMKIEAVIAELEEGS